MMMSYQVSNKLHLLLSITAHHGMNIKIMFYLIDPLQPCLDDLIILITHF